jgi:hypothetical protein
MKELTENLWQTPVDKARLVKQDDLITRQKFEAKDQAMEVLKTEAHKLLKEKDDTIHALAAEVWYYYLIYVNRSYLTRLLTR